MNDIFKDKLMAATHETEEDVELRKLYERFPNHAAEFQRIIDSLSNGDEIVEGVPVAPDTDVSISSISKKQMSLLCSMHQNVYQSKIRKADDSCRIRAFLWSQDAACDILQEIPWIDGIQDENNFAGATVMSVALRTACLRGANVKYTHRNSDVIDFHHDPNPIETQKAEPCLSSFMLRVNQLLRAFPGHAVLVALAQVVTKVRRLDISCVPVGKVLVAIEIVLRKAQEWEQHASERVKLGSALTNLGVLVVKWRKLELANWKILLDQTELRYHEKAQRHWLKLYVLLCHNQSIEVDEKVTSYSPHQLPAWVWKGVKGSKNKEIINSSDAKDEYLMKLLQLFDTFMLSSIVGEFNARLEYIGSFANQIIQESLHINENQATPRFKLGTMLHSLWKHYTFLQPIIDSTKSSGREPIEEQLMGEVKIAKWDDQSYYALRDTSEKSHTKLMTFISNVRMNLFDL